MKPLTLSFCAAIVLALALFGIPESKTMAAIRPTPTPTPVAIAYDEIQRTVMPPATAPPPGAFQGDYDTIMSAAPPAGSESTPTPEPKHRGGLGGMLGSVLSNPGGPGASMGDAMSQMHRMQSGTLTRYTFYWLHGWVRTDDPVAQTAIIEKCNLHTWIYLNLAKKTYRIDDTTPKACDSPSMPNGGGRATEAAYMAPGTADLSMKSTIANLGPKTLESIPTIGYNKDSDMSMSNSTGSCHDSDFKMLEVEYVSQIHKQRAYCPISIVKAPAQGASGMMRGGCKPVMHMGGSSGTGPNPDLLEMYIKTMFGSSGQPGMGGFAQVTQRGHVTWYLKPDVDPLFVVPPGFTQEQAGT